MALRCVVQTNRGVAGAEDWLGIGSGPALRISKTHIDPFVLGQSGADYTVTVANAGHPEPLLLTPGGRAQSLPMPTSN